MIRFAAVLAQLDDDHDVTDLEALPFGAEEPRPEPAGVADVVVVDEDLAHVKLHHRPESTEPSR